MLKKIRKAWKRYDPAEIVKRKYGLKGWKAELADWIVGFGVAALLYFILLPMLLGSYPPAVVVQTCSMKGTLNVGDISVLHGVSFNELNAPLVELDSPLSYTISPNNLTQETQELVFPNGQRVPLDEAGDIIVFDSLTSGMQLIHRAVAKVRASDGEFYITKGDANSFPDSVKVECAEWESVGGNTRRCIKLSARMSSVCSESDRGWPGCLAAPVPAGSIAGRQLFLIPLLGHVKLATFHIITLGTMGYPGPLWC